MKTMCNNCGTEHSTDLPCGWEEAFREGLHLETLAEEGVLDQFTARLKQLPAIAGSRDDDREVFSLKDKRGIFIHDAWIEDLGVIYVCASGLSTDVAELLCKVICDEYWDTTGCFPESIHCHTRQTKKRRTPPKRVASCKCYTLFRYPPDSYVQGYIDPEIIFQVDASSVRNDAWTDAEALWGTPLGYARYFYHEAAHAVAAIAFGRAFEKIAIGDPEDEEERNVGGIVVGVRETPWRYLTRDESELPETEASIVGCLAGLTAESIHTKQDVFQQQCKYEKRVCDDYTKRAREGLAINPALEDNFIYMVHWSDLAQARKYITRLPWSKRGEGSLESDEQLLFAYRDRAKELMQAHWIAVSALAEALMNKWDGWCEMAFEDAKRIVMEAEPDICDGGGAIDDVMGIAS